MTRRSPMQPAFPLGNIYITRGASDALNHSDVLGVLGRHVQGDWGDVCEEDKQANDAAVRDGERILSAYVAESGTRFWVITEADRSATTVLLPDEY